MPKPQERKKITHMHMCTNTHTCKYLTNKAGVFRLVHCYCHLLVPLVQMKYSDSVHIQILMFWQDFFNLRGFLEDEVRAISVAKPQIHTFLSLSHTHTLHTTTSLHSSCTCLSDGMQSRTSPTLILGISCL